MFCKIGTLKTFASFTGKHLRRSNVNLSKLIGWDTATFFNKCQQWKHYNKDTRTLVTLLLLAEFIPELFLLFRLFTMNR